MQANMQTTPLTLPMIFRRVERIFPDKTVVTAGPKPAGRSGAAGHDDLRRVGRADPPPRRRARRARHLRRRPGRDLRLEHRPPPRAVLRRAVHRAGAAHPQHPPVRRPARLHRQPRRGRGHLRRPVPPRRCSGRSSTGFETVRHIVVMDDGADVDVPDDPRILDYEALLAAAEPVDFRGRRREPGRGHVLHERHDRQPEGGRVLPPLDRPALDGGDDGRQRSA